jgi:hypothetical protein
MDEELDHERGSQADRQPSRLVWDDPQKIVDTVFISTSSQTVKITHFLAGHLYQVIR